MSDSDNSITNNSNNSIDLIDSIDSNNTNKTGESSKVIKPKNTKRGRPPKSVKVEKTIKKNDKLIDPNESVINHDVKKRGRKKGKKNENKTLYAPEEFIDFMIYNYPKLELNKIRDKIINELKERKFIIHRPTTFNKFTYNDETFYYYPENGQVINKDCLNVGRFIKQEDNSWKLFFFENKIKECIDYSDKFNIKMTIKNNEISVDEKIQTMQSRLSHKLSRLNNIQIDKLYESDMFIKLFDKILDLSNKLEKDLENIIIKTDIKETTPENNQNPVENIPEITEEMIAEIDTNTEYNSDVE